jgi:predicted kinase
VAQRGELDEALVDELAGVVAEMHGQAPRADEVGPYGTPEVIAREVRGNFETLYGLGNVRDEETLKRVQRCSEAALASLGEVFRDRLAGGFVRECHGDLHLQNLALMDGRVIPFDGVEFEPAFRWVDVASDLAFLLMDLHARSLGALAWRLLNGYLARTGDHGLLAVLRHYLAYRAMVRAKVSAIRAGQLRGDASDDASRCEALIALAGDLGRGENAPPLVLTHGVSGSGKSWLAARLAPVLGAVWLRSDVERARLFPDGQRRYGADATDATYARLLDLADSALNAGFPVIVDATFQDPRQRERFMALARGRGSIFRILDLEAPARVLRQRVRHRSAMGDDPSQADEAVLDAQLKTARPLEDAERPVSLGIDTTADPDVDDICAWIRSPGKGHRP